MTKQTPQKTLQDWLEDERTYYERARGVQNKYSIEDVRLWSGIDILTSIISGESEQP